MARFRRPRLNALAAAASSLRRLLCDLQRPVNQGRRGVIAAGLVAASLPNFVRAGHGRDRAKNPLDHLPLTWRLPQGIYQIPVEEWPADVDLALRVSAPQVHAFLTVQAINLTPVQDPLGWSEMCLVAKDKQKRAYLVFELPPQRIDEIAIWRCASCGQPAVQPQVPFKGIAATPSRLVFEVPPEALPLRTTLTQLLKWHHLRMIVGPAVAEAPERPTALESFIDFYKLYFRPAVAAPQGAPSPLGFVVGHLGRQGSSNEVWTARLYDRTFESVDERFGLSITAFGADKADTVEAKNCNDLETPILNEHRDGIVSLSHLEQFCARPIFARHLLLSSLGAWARLDKIWPPIGSTYGKIDLYEYAHTLSQQRDSHIKITRIGYLFPFGHSALYAEYSDRTIGPATSPIQARAAHAYLEKRGFIEILQPTITFDDPLMPFRSVTIKIKKTEPLDPPLASSVSKTSGGTWGKDAFWPFVCGAPYAFPMEGVDWDGNTVQFSLPLIWMGNAVSICAHEPCSDDVSVCEDLTVCGTGSQVLVRAAVSDAASSFRINYGGGVVNMASQPVAMAPAPAADRATVHTAQLRFVPKYRTPPAVSAAPCEIISNLQPPFQGIPEYVDCEIPALKALSDGQSGVGRFRIVEPRSNNAGLFLLSYSGAPGEIKAGFGTNSLRSGGSLAPSPSIDAVSVIYGPTNSSIATFTGPQPFRVAAVGSFFDALDAKLFGVIPLNGIISAVVAADPEGVPSILKEMFEEEDAPNYISASLDWNTENFSEWPAGSDAIFVPSSDANAKTRFTIAARSKVWVTAPFEPEIKVSAEVKDFFIRLGYQGNGIQITIKRVFLESINGSKPEPTVDVGDVSFYGPVLGFVNDLADLLRDFIGGGSKSIEVTAEEICVHLPSIDIPAFNIGTLQFLQFALLGKVRIPFRNDDPLQFSFSLSSPEKPFLLVLNAYAGSGYVALDLEATRTRRFEISLSFGLARDLDFGGIVHGQVTILGGFTYRCSSQPRGNGAYFSTVDLDAFVRATGQFTAFGFLSLWLELYVGLHAYQAPSESYVMGICRCSVNAKVGFISYGYTVTYTQRFAGSGGSSQNAAIKEAAFLPQIADKRPMPEATPGVSFSQWTDYRNSFIRRQACR